MSNRTEKFIHNHNKQLLTNLIPARKSVNLWGRATGKTAGVTAEKAYFNVATMPGSVGAIGCPSFTHMMEHILPELIKTWKKMGLEEGIDFWCFKQPPQGIPEAIRPVKDPKRVVFFKNGSAIKLFSLNYSSLNHGDSIDWLIVEEARHCKFEKLKEVFLCVRGNDDVFGKLPQHTSVLLVSDLPQNPDQNWLIDYQEDMDEAAVQEVINLQYHKQMLVEKGKSITNASTRKTNDYAIRLLEEEINEISSKLTYFCLASTLDNIHALGVSTLKGFKRDLSEYDYLVSVLNEIQKKTKQGFYPDLDESIHAYITPPSKHWANIDFTQERNCLWDGDLNWNIRLSIAMDYNSKASHLAIGQRIGNQFNLNNTSIVVEHPEKRKQLIEKFNTYYGPFTLKEIDFYFDNTAIGTDADKGIDESYAAKTISELEAFGWKVNPMHIKQAPTHKWRYTEWGEVFRATESAYIQFRYNQDLCQNWVDVAQQTKVIQIVTDKGTVIKKDKSSETDNKTPPTKATHITEAVDGLVMGVVLFQFSNQIQTDHIGTIIG